VGTHGGRGVTTTEAGPRRLQRRRAVGPQVLMLVAGVAGLVVTLAALRPGAGGQRIAIAARDLEAGTVLTDHDVRFERLAASDAVSAVYVTPQELARLRGRVLTTAAFAHEPVLEAHLRTRAATDGRRAMSIPVDRARAVNGKLAPGDRVDVVAAGDDEVTIVVAGAEVLDVDGDDAFGTRRGEIRVTLAVDARESQLLTAALADGDFVLTRVTGAPPAGDLPPLVTARPTR
jgi:Flp pilus assembly protein CpaB